MLWIRACKFFIGFFLLYTEGAAMGLLKILQKRASEICEKESF